MAKNKHLTNDERLQIEHLLGEATPLSQIAKKLDKHKSTISREVRARAETCDKGAAHHIRNRCDKRRDCNKHRTKLIVPANAQLALYATRFARTTRRKFVTSSMNLPTSATAARTSINVRFAKNTTSTKKLMSHTAKRLLNPASARTSPRRNYSSLTKWSAPSSGADNLSITLYQIMPLISTSAKNPSTAMLTADYYPLKTLTCRVSAV